MKLATALIIVGLGASALGGVWLHGQHYGVLACEAGHEAARQRVQRDLFTSAENMSRREYDLRQQQDALAARAQEHEDAARADADHCRVPAADSVRRLQRRWAAD